ncbi:DUF1269 domain-containing protein [Methanothrix sp.]|jgi:uncharacterized membrane protein|uniref:DUF1269 domain-containing protein n=1 Tax=Methanothrix sp. TaxID=90426 RepID=UPI003BB70353|nr:DUF1269 domain-containing protein [Proteiniphilum sp.]
MSDLVVLALDTEIGAEEMRDELVRLQKEHLITLSDAAVVVRQQDGHVKVKQAVSLVGVGAMGGAFWGLLIGILFWMPWLGMIIGAASGALAGRFSDVGVDDEFIEQVGSTVQPGNSALFLLVEKVTPDKVITDLMKFKNVKVLKTSLSQEQEDKLKAAFAAPDVKA